MKLERAVGGGWSASCASSLTVIIQIIEFVTWYAWNDCIRTVGSTLFFLARPIPALRCHQLCKCYATVHSVHVSGCRQNRLKIENSRFCDNIQGSATLNSFLALLGHHGIPREALHVRKSTVLRCLLLDGCLRSFKPCCFTVTYSQRMFRQLKYFVHWLLTLDFILGNFFVYRLVIQSCLCWLVVYHYLQEIEHFHDMRVILVWNNGRFGNCFLIG